MIKPPIPSDEASRLTELYATELLYTDPEEVFDRVTSELARIFEMPVATMSLIDRDTQFYKAATGLPPELLATRTTSRDVSICGHVVGNNQLLVVDDLSKDHRFQDNPLIAQTGARFYAGAPLRLQSGRAIGSLCIIDTKPRHLTDRETKLLSLIADGVMAEVHLRSASRHLAERNRAIELDLVQARNVQRFLLPPPLLEGKRFSLCHLYYPYDKVGGDFIDVLVRPDTSIFMLLADVSGHGVSAALTSAMTKTSFHRFAESVLSPQELLTSINRDMASTTDAGRFMTAVAALYDPRIQAAQIAVAGHPPPLLLRERAVVRLQPPRDLPLLVDPVKQYHAKLDVKLRAGDRLLFYTDGAIEAMNADHRCLGLDGLVRFAADNAASHGPNFLDQLLVAVRGFSPSPLSDDIALLCLESRE